MKKLLIAITLILSTLASAAEVLSESRSISLAGEWQLMIDRQGKGENEGWQKIETQYDDSILLPGSMPQRLKGDDISVKTPWVGAIYDSSFYHNPFMAPYRKEGNMKMPFFLTPVKHYVGKAWYRKTVTLTAKQMQDDWMLYLERPHIISKVWVNGTEVAGRNTNSLSVPHVWNMGGALKVGENVITICVDNDPDAVGVGQDSHSVTDQTQGCWNGMVGKIELRKASALKSVKVYPDVDNRKAKVLLNLKGLRDEVVKVTLIAESFNTAKRHIVTVEPTAIRLQNGEAQEKTLTLDMGEDMLLWDEFCPQLYRLTAEVTTKRGTEYHETYFGMRKMEIRGKMFFINGRKILLRGNVDSCLFPETGFPPTDLDAWVALFEKQKAWGINHVRFHSWCPPENAFLAADIVGIYLQPEGPSWPNHGVKLGRGEKIDTYLYEESKRICDEYGNHPSFTFFAFGNEPAGNWVKWCNDHMAKIKDYDPRHLYAGFSVGGGWAWQPKTEFAVKAGARGLAEWVRRAPENMTDFSEKITTYNGKDMPGTPITIPFVTHEMGQWCVFPNFNEIEKYKGVNKAGNMEIFRDLLKTNGMEERGHDFLMASGKLQALCYKYETERILRTPDYAGYQLLALNDYSGQGSALVGLTDVFYDEKGYITPREFREYNSQIVPLAKFKKFTYTNKEVFEFEAMLAHYGRPLTEQDPKRKEWYIECEMTPAPEKQGDVMTLNEPEPLATKRIALTEEEIEGGGLFSKGKIRIDFYDVKKAGKYTLSMRIPGTEIRNHWDIWVYPVKKNKIASDADEGGVICEMEGVKETIKIKMGKRIGTMMFGDIYITDSLDTQAEKMLKKGGKVLICAAGKVTYGKEVKQQFLPVFWNTSWFKMRPPHTTGLYIEQQHPVFRHFPTDYHSDLQWWELVNRAQVMQFTDFPENFQPLVQSIDTWFVSRKIGMLFEANVGKGRLMMTTMDISHDLQGRHAARYLRESILSYMMDNEAFRPQHTIDKERIADLFTKVAGEVNMFTNDSPDELKPKLK